MFENAWSNSGVPGPVGDRAVEQLGVVRPIVAGEADEHPS